MDSMIAALVVGGLSRTTNGGALWESIADSTGPQGRNIGAIGIDPENPERIYVSAYSDGRLYISTNDGLTWKNTLPDILYGGGGYHFEFGDPSSTLYMAGSRTVAASKGIFKSSDRGTSWINISAGIPGNFANVWCITRRLRSIPDALFAGISWSFDFRPDTVFGHGVFTSSDGGQSWQDIGIDSDRKSTRLNSSHIPLSRMPSSACKKQLVPVRRRDHHRPRHRRAHRPPPRRPARRHPVFFNDTATTEIYPLSLHDALPICRAAGGREGGADRRHSRSLFGGQR